MQIEARHKKSKDDKTTNTVILDGEYFTLLIEALIEVAQARFKKIYDRKIKLTCSITDLLTVLCKDVKHIRTTTDYTPHITEL